MMRAVSCMLTTLLLSLMLACGNQTVPVPSGPTVPDHDAVSSATKGSAAEPSAPESAPTAQDGRLLVAYFSRAGENYGVGTVRRGSTELVAEQIAELTGADVFRIQTVTPYPESYEECKRIVTQERDSGARPELLSVVADFDEYDAVFLGYPIWYGDMPMAVYTFLESCDFTGKTVYPFCTHAGSGLSGTVQTLKNKLTGAAVADGLAIAGTAVQNRPEETRQSVSDWLDRLGVQA